MKPRFKDKKLDKVYQGLIGKTPDELTKLSISGVFGAAFRCGYRGIPKPDYVLRTSAAYAAYVAGKETRKMKIKAK